MPSIINSNISSLVTQNNLNRSQSSLSTSLERLSSGLRINSAKDDAAGLAISDRATTQINGFTVAARNANDAISLSQTAEGSLSAIGNNLQRIRELALQSANSTNSASDRQALNAEAQQLIAEVQRVGTTSQFNGLSLLDGTFASSQFQVGANANQTINVSIAGATTNILGAYQAQSTAVTSTGLDGAHLTINGVAIGASAATSAAGLTAGSAAAKAVAINAASANTGVSATASTAVTGIAPIAGSSLSNGTLLINGISVGSIAGDASAITQGQNTATAINAISNQTGVSATTNLSTGALSLTSSEGRDIAISASPGTAASVAQIRSATGLTATSGAGAAAATVGSSTFTTNGTTAGRTVTVNGILFTWIDAGAGNPSDATVVDATHVNVFQDYTNITALTDPATIILAFNEAKADSRTAPAISTLTISTTGPTNVTLTDSRLGSAATAGRSVSSSVWASNLNASGGDGTLGANGALATTHGNLLLSSASNFTLGGTQLADVGLSTANPALTKLAAVDISTVTGSNAAIAVLDGALAQVNSQRASLGAYQNRFAATVDNLQTSAQNLTAARSRTRDADFASETANLSRSQVLQQAGIAILAQANTLPQQVLSLLR
jgi:flagellin